jgi:enamine deaminase RidA (YjgF/YER057c/UK114 family)
MQRAVAERIIQAAKELDQAFGQLDTAVDAVEEEDERHRMHRVLIGAYADLLHHITRSVLVEFPDLHPDSPPNFRPNRDFKPGLPVRRIDPGPRLSEATIHDDRMYLSGMVASDTSQDVSGQTNQVLVEIGSLLEKGGSHRTKILSALMFLADMNDFAAVNAVWDDWIVAETSPARATVQARLSDPNAKIEIMVVAAL